MSTENGRNRRQIKNIVLDPLKQYRHALTYFGFTVLGALVIQAVILHALNGFVVQAVFLSGVDPARLTGLLEQLSDVFFWRAVVMFPILAWGCLVLSLRMTHRFLGPQVPIRRHVKAMIEGDYASRCHVREKDELRELAGELNELAEVLQSRHGDQELERAA